MSPSWGPTGGPPVGAPSTRVSSRDALWPVRSTLDSRIVRMTSAPSAADKAARFGRGVAPRGVLRGFGLFCFPPRLRSAILRPVCCAPVRLAIITPDTGHRASLKRNAGARRHLGAALPAPSWRSLQPSTA